MKIMALMALGMGLVGCMSDKEFALRNQDLQAKAQHPATFPVCSIKGKMVLEEGSEFVIQTPTQPFTPTAIPDGQAIWAGTLKDITNTAALVGTAAIGMSKAGDSTHKTYNSTTTAEE